MRSLYPNSNPNPRPCTPAARCCPCSQTALLNPLTFITECFGPKLVGHLKHLLCCAVFVAIIIFGAPVFNAVIPIFSYV